MIGESFIDVDFCQQAKTGQVVSGDVFLSRKIKEEGRIISVLSDGLGSGVKAERAGESDGHDGVALHLGVRGCAEERRRPSWTRCPSARSAKSATRRSRSWTWTRTAKRA